MMGRFIGTVVEARFYEDAYMGITFLELKTQHDESGYLVPFYTENLREDITEDNFSACLARWADEGVQLWEEFGGGHFAYGLLWNEEDPHIDCQPIECNEIAFPLVKMIAASVLKRVPWSILVSGYVNGFTDAIVIEEVEDEDGYIQEIERESEPYFECFTDVFFGEGRLVREYKKMFGVMEKEPACVGGVDDGSLMDDEDMPF